MRRSFPAVFATALAALSFASTASATNTRVSIAYYKWSNKEVHIDLGEKVTWDWLGPDLAHSVTGISPNDLQWDSDPHTDAPFHRAGYSYALQFEQPGTYVFQCKLHPFVRGEVIVSDTPGDPSSDPGPQPPEHRRDAAGPERRPGQAPGRGEVRGADDRAGQRAIPARSAVLPASGRWQASLRRLPNLGTRPRHVPDSPRCPLSSLRSRSGRYEAVLRATDPSANESKPVKLRFSIYR